MPEIPPHERFLRIDAVLGYVGLSKSQFYRRQKDTDPALNPTPKPHHYQRDEKNGSFYLLTDVLAWMSRELGPGPRPGIDDLLG